MSKRNKSRFTSNWPDLIALKKSDFLKHSAIKNCAKNFPQKHLKNFLKSLKKYNVSKFSDVIIKQKIKYDCSINTRKTKVHFKKITHKNMLQVKQRV